MSNQAQTPSYRIGFALNSKKERSFIQPSLLAHASHRGIDLIRIDPNKPLIEQGPFNCVIHKFYKTDWPHQLLHFSSQNPNVPIIDSPQSIERLNSRISMLEVVTQLKIKFQDDTSFGVPKQVVVSDMEHLANLLRENTSEELNVMFPIIAKPLLADGSVNSHELCLVFDDEGLEKLKPPVVLQEFVNHGGVVFKVYVVGSFVKCVKRKSLRDISEEKMKSLQGSLSFSQISNLSDNDKMKDGDFSEVLDLERVEMPSESFVVELARALREAMGLNLFNFDLIRDARDCDRYLVIDINYFPGYEKMPSFESVLTDFLLDVVNKKHIMVNDGDE